MNPDSYIEFVSEDHLKSLGRIVAKGRKLDAAVAFWGDGSTEQLKLHAAQKGSRIICNLFSAGCNPHEIQKLFNLKRFDIFRHEGLHAKVYLSDEVACIGSSNVSDAGLGFGTGKHVKQREANIITNDSGVLDRAKVWFEKLLAESTEVTQPDISLAVANYNPGGGGPPLPELIDLPRGNLKSLNMAVMVWGVEADEVTHAAGERLKKTYGLPPSTLAFYDTKANATQYPYGKTALIFDASEDRELGTFQGVNYFEPQSDWGKSNGLYVIWSANQKQKGSAWIIPGAKIRIGKRTKDLVAERLKARNVKLRHDLHTRKKTDGFATWEPLHEFLA